MKVFLVLLVLVTTAVFVFGAPFSSQKPIRESRWQSPGPVLPMTFAHKDHVTESCLICHHNYNDDTGGGPCMLCHVTNQDVWPLLETQFHELCRACHADKQHIGEKGGPARSCIACHLDDDLP